MVPLQYVRLAVLLVAGLLFLNYANPNQPESMVFWMAMGALLVAMAGLVRPGWWLGLGTRRRAGWALVASAAAAGGALAWPATPELVLRPETQLDANLPAYDFREYHEVEVAATAEQTRRAVYGMTDRDIPLANALVAVRRAFAPEQLPGAVAGPVLAGMRDGRSGFLVLSESEAEVVCVMAGAPWKNRVATTELTPAYWRGYQEPDAIRVAFSFRWAPAGPGRTRLSTETRVQATDSEARRRMAAYWRVIGPGSGLIRRVMLRAAAKRAEGR